jgi:1,4-alpha-glucan branching enzyme
MAVRRKNSTGSEGGEVKTSAESAQVPATKPAEETAKAATTKRVPKPKETTQPQASPVVATPDPEPAKPPIERRKRVRETVVPATKATKPAKTKKALEEGPSSMPPMAKQSSKGAAPVAPAKAKVPGERRKAPRKLAAPTKATQNATVNELETVGAVVVPTVTIEVDTRQIVNQPDEVLSEAGPILIDAPAQPAAPEPASNATPASAKEEPFASAREERLATTPAISTAATETATPRSEVTSLLSDWDFHLFNEGTHNKLWQKLGSHIVPGGVVFAVWAPNAERVSVVGDFNGWSREANPLERRGESGIWEGFIAGVERGATYKYHIVSRVHGYRVDKADPMAVHHEVSPATASKVWDLDYEWQDADWMAGRKARMAYEAPITIYELHLGSWRRVSDDEGATWRPMSYREIAQPLAEYVKKMNFTHIELMPLQEHPFYGSWGYQGTGYFAPTSRYGTPQDLKYLIDVLHQNDIGVLIDWVPSHFPTDEHGLAFFDGTHLYEHSDPRKGFHPDWGSLIFNYGRNEVRSFLLSSALYWLDEYHIDGLRVDAVASMLYLDYSRKHGEWIPNEHGGRENLEAISFLQRVNQDIYASHPDVQVIAEESTAWPLVSRPTYVGGLGFGMKWDMGWMHDTLRYFAKDPVYRKFHHNDLTFRMMYAFTENFVLPLSHDEVVHGKGSLMGKMPGDEWRRAANLRLLFAHMYANPGKKLLFMGGELGQYREWNHDASLDWHLLEQPTHAGIQRWVEDLNKAYRDIPAFHELDMAPEGFEWIDCCDTEGSVVSLLRRSQTNPDEILVAVMNFTPMPRYNYQVGMPLGGTWTEVLNSDAPVYGGSGQGNMGTVEAVPLPLHGRRWSVNLTLPPLGAVFLLSTPAVAGETEEASEASAGSDIKKGEESEL